MEKEKLSDTLGAMGANLLTQENRATALPIYAVEELERIYGFDTDYADENIAWLDVDSDEVKGEEAEELEDHYQSTGEVKEDYTRTAYLDRWKFVQPFFTEAAAKAYIEANKHNLTEPRIYVYSGYRNVEWEAVRQYFMSEAPENPHAKMWHAEAVRLAKKYGEKTFYNF